MPNQITITEDQKKLAHFLAEKIIDLSHRIDPTFSKDANLVDTYADILLSEYAGVEWKPPVAVSISGDVSKATFGDEPVDVVESYDSGSIFDKDFPVAAGISVHVTVKNPSDRNYDLVVDANFLGKKVGGISLQFKDGELSTKNSYKSPLIDVWYRASINFNSGVHIELDADVKIWTKDKFHVGPINIDI